VLDPTNLHVTRFPGPPASWHDATKCSLFLDTQILVVMPSPHQRTYYGGLVQAMSKTCTMII
jgi:hypothetical protein